MIQLRSASIGFIQLRSVDQISSALHRILILDRFTRFHQPSNYIYHGKSFSYFFRPIISLSSVHGPSIFVDLISFFSSFPLNFCRPFFSHLLSNFQANIQKNRSKLSRVSRELCFCVGNPIQVESGFAHPILPGLMFQSWISHPSWHLAMHPQFSSRYPSQQTDPSYLTDPRSGCHPPSI